MNQNQQIMKNLNLKLFVIAIGVCTIYACKPEKYYPEENPEVPEDTITVEQPVAESQEVRDARVRFEEAEINLKRAMDSGDKAAQEAAQKARDDAQQAWDAVKNAANDAANFVEDGAQKTADGVKKAANEVGNTSREAYQDTKEGVKNVSKDVKEGADKAVEDVKNIGK